MKAQGTQFCVRNEGSLKYLAPTPKQSGPVTNPALKRGESRSEIWRLICWEFVHYDACVLFNPTENGDGGWRSGCENQYIIKWNRVRQAGTYGKKMIALLTERNRLNVENASLGRLAAHQKRHWRISAARRLNVFQYLMLKFMRKDECNQTLNLVSPFPQERNPRCRLSYRPLGSWTIKEFPDWLGFISAISPNFYSTL